MKVEIRKTDYPRKSASFSVWVVNENGTLLCAHPETYEATARVVAAAMASLIRTQGGRALVLATAAELG